MGGAEVERVAGRDLPAGWHVVERRRAGPFTAAAVLEMPDGGRVTWTSRRHRKRLGLLPGRGLVPTSARRGHADAASWAMGILFGIGSLCFALGSLPLYFDAVAPSTTAITFFVGSIFFTSAAAVQLHESFSAPEDVDPDAPGRPLLDALVRWRPRSIDWWASAIQFVGTLFFNVTTWAATREDLDLAQEKVLVWAPDVLGSICFLVASYFAYAEVNRGNLPRPDGSVGWRIALVNMGGSLAFGISAIAARYLHSTGEVANVTAVNLFTFIGAVGFLIGAVLLPVESARDAAESPVSDPPSADPPGPGRYELVLKGRPGTFLATALEGFRLTGDAGGRVHFVGSVKDQAELHGILHRLQDLRVDILEVRRLGP